VTFMQFEALTLKTPLEYPNSNSFVCRVARLKAAAATHTIRSSERVDRSKGLVALPKQKASRRNTMLRI
jgi:hypothetical protein